MAERIITYREAIKEALSQEMERNSKIFLMGEDIGRYGGIYAVTKGLQNEFPGRVLDTPITEAGFIGAGIGAAMTGWRPVVELMYFDFCLVAIDQIINHAAKLRYISGGQTKIPLVIRSPYGAGVRFAAQHSQSLYAFFVHVPGTKVVVPSTPYDVKGLLTQAMRSDDPVIFLEHKTFYGMKGPVPEEQYAIPFGQAKTVKEGTDVTVVGFGAMVERCLEAARSVQAQGVSAEVIDLRTLEPLDKKAVLDSVKKTGRLVVVDEDYPKCSMADYIAAFVSEEAFGYIDAPIRRVQPPSTPVPFSPGLEDEYRPSAQKIASAITSVSG